MSSITTFQILAHCKRHKLPVPSNVAGATKILRVEPTFHIGNGQVLAMSITLDLRTVSEANTAGHLRAKLARKKAQRNTVRTALAKIACALPPLPVKVTLVRHGVRTLDSDNLASAMKHCRDGVAEVYGPDDADERYEWVVDQIKSKRYAVEIRIERQTQ